jgi:excisionase family DNA binding protein
VTRLLTVGEVAQRLAVSAKTVRRRIDDGEIAVFRSGRVVRVREEDFRRYVAGHTTRTRAASSTVEKGGRVLTRKLWEPTG